MSETGKASNRRDREGFFNKYCVGKGIDIGCGNAPLLPEIDKWDQMFGNSDATFMHGVHNEFYDYVYSSHCLEDLTDPIVGLRNWFRILKQGGLLILYLPDRDAYEKKALMPSNWNPNHKFFITIERTEPPNTFSILDILTATRVNHEILYVKKCIEGHTIVDPSKHSDGEFSIELVARKI